MAVGLIKTYHTKLKQFVLYSAYIKLGIIYKTIVKYEI